MIRDLASVHPLLPIFITAVVVTVLLMFAESWLSQRFLRRAEMVSRDKPGFELYLKRQFGPSLCRAWWLYRREYANELPGTSVVERYRLVLLSLFLLGSLGVGLCIALLVAIGLTW
ncbi:MAG: hypothetical protein WD534_06140 [Phycisphaeraceae bacterium]